MEMSIKIIEIKHVATIFVRKGRISEQRVLYSHATHSVCFELQEHYLGKKRKRKRMKCPYCGFENIKTLETRDSPDNVARRRKECIDCGKRFTTYEYVETIELMVRKKDGRLERFDLNKIVRGLQKACEKRPVTLDQIHELAEHVRQDLMALGKDEASSTEIGDLVIKHLKKLDRVAYIRFASVYKKFEEPEDFQKLLKEVKT